MKSHLKFQALKKRKSLPKKLKIATFDIEASNWVNFEILGFYDGKEYIEFYDIESFLKHILSYKFRNYKIFAHFGGKYDFLFLLEKLIDSAELIEVNGSIIQIKIGFNPYKNKHGLTKYKNYIYFRDSYRILPASLKKLTEAFKVKHKKLDFEDYENIGINEETKRYLKNDVIGLYEVIKEYENLLFSIGGELKLTLASTALDLYQRKFMENDWIFLTYHKYDRMVRKSYFGGRTEVFKKYMTNGYYYDVNSLYPSVMKKFPFPIGQPIYIQEYNYNREDTGIIEIEVNIPKNISIPLLPEHINGMMQYRTGGKIKGIYPSPYLKKLDELGIDFICFDALIFGSEYIFTDYVDTLYKLRLQNKDNALNLITKLLLNSLYGKFAQKIKRKNFFANPTESELIDKIHDQDIYNYNEKADLWYYETTLELNYILPAISSFVTAYAQLELYQYLENFDVYYCDTDSIFTPDKIETSKELGKLKLEAEIREAVFLSQKLYAYIDNEGNEKITAKGFPLKILKQHGYEFTFDNFKQALFKNDYSIFNVRYNSMFGFKEALNRKNKYLYHGEKKKSIKNLDRKRKFFGFESIPYYITE